MRILLFLIATACVGFGQVGDAKRVIRGNGLPPAGRCAGLKQVGTEYVNTAPGGLAYACLQPTANTFTWTAVGSGSGGAPTAGTGILVADSEVSINTAVTQTLANDQANGATYCRSITGNDSYACSLNPALTAYTRGMYIVLDADTANTGAATLSINGLAALTILTRAGATPANGDIVANRGTLLYYNGTDLSIVGDGGGGAAGGSDGNLQFNNAGALGGIANSSSPNAGELLLGTSPAASATRSAFGQGIALSGGSAAGTYHGINHSGGGFTGNWFNYQQGGANQFRAMAVAANAAPGMIINGNNYPVGGYMLCSAAGNCSAISSDHVEGLKIAHNSDSTFLTGVAIGFPREGGMQHLANPGAKPACAVGTRGLQWFTFSGAGVKDVFEVCAKDAANAYAWRVIY